MKNHLNQRSLFHHRDTESQRTQGSACVRGSESSGGVRACENSVAGRGRGSVGSAGFSPSSGAAAPGAGTVLPCGLTRRLFHPSSFSLHPLFFTLPPFLFILPPSFFLLHSSSFLLHLSSLILLSSRLVVCSLFSSSSVPLRVFRPGADECLDEWLDECYLLKDPWRRMHECC